MGRSLEGDDVGEQGEELDGFPLKPVMAGLDPAIHVFRASDLAKTWIRGSSPRMTEEGEVRIVRTSCPF